MEPLSVTYRPEKLARCLFAAQHAILGANRALAKVTRTFTQHVFS
jgi:hypothetical protein